MSAGGSMRPLPSGDELRSWLSYDPETGVFKWKAKPSARMSDCDLLREPGTIRAGYRDICIRGINYGSHRLAWKYVHDIDPDGEVDHINGNRCDNRIANLRVASNTEQRKNSAKPRSNTSGAVGVSFRSDKGKWRAFIGHENRCIHLGYFETQQEAECARAGAEWSLGFHENHGRQQCP